MNKSTAIKRVVGLFKRTVSRQAQLSGMSAWHVRFKRIRPIRSKMIN